MPHRTLLSWVAGCCGLILASLAGGAHAQPLTEGGEAGFAAPVPYGYPTHMAGPNPYWVTGNPEQPQLFTSGDPLQSAFRSYDGWFFRTEYLMWDFRRPGDVLLGAPQFGVADPRSPRQIFDNSTNPATLLGVAKVPSLDSMTLDHNNGVRGVFGIPLVFGSFEASVYGFNKAQSVLEDKTLNGTVAQPFLGTTTYVNGALGDNIFLYNDSFRAVFNSRLWGSEANFFIDGTDNGLLFFQTMVGFRYLDFREDLKQTGSFVSPAIPDIVTNIDSFTKNQMYIPQIGLRTTLDAEFASISLDTKFGLGANNHEQAVQTYHLRSLGDPLIRWQSEATNIVPMIDLGVTGKLRLSPNVLLTAGYNLIFVSNITRPQDNIYYNDNGPLPNLPAVSLKTHRQDMVFNGFSVGCEIRLP